ncbi:SubName: Full=Uncharacterized protein {ECO:0000313/EMBL:CCA73556.1} [Serendipita indica DSM 11827]|nr:SubName: Full=Uncharacterized protein {ECO:0000313/EMBL:CCA73556.1} [Serendipita indica DSM 11827]
MDPSSFLWHSSQPEPSSHTTQHPLTGLQGSMPNGGAVRMQQGGQNAWGPDVGYLNGRLDPQTLQQGMYDPSWNYGLYPEYDDAHALGINPTNLLTQSNRTANGLSTGDAPTTVDPKMMSVASSAYPQYLPPTAAQFRPSSYQSTSNLAGYPPMLALSAMDSTLGDALDYEPTPETLSEQPSTPPTASTPPAPPAKPLIDQVKSLLTPKHLDKDPRGTAEKLFSLLIVSADQDKVSFVNTDKDTRMEVLTRIRDHAPKEFYTLYGKNLDALVLLRDWGKDAVKKEAYIETAMNWLQVVDKIPITVPMLVESGLGKIVKFLADRPPTRVNANKTTKKRKEEPTPPAKNASLASTTQPAAKKAVITTASGAKLAVRRDSAGSPASTPAPSASSSATASTSTSASASASGAGPVKGAQSDSSFFSKPKAKLPSFRKKVPIPTSSTSSTASKDESTPPATMDYTFEDALKAVRKGSPAVGPNPVSSSNTIIASETSVSGISAKTGKPKKSVRFAPDGELEKIRWIEKAIYDGDTVHGSVHAQNYRDMDRAEGNLLRHMIEQIEWYEPPLVAIPLDIQSVNRGELSKEAKAQEEREASTLAAVYQGAPPDTPVEPPHLASLPLTPDESSTKAILLGTDIDDLVQGSKPPELAQVDSLLSTLGSSSTPDPYASLYPATAQQAPTTQIVDLLNMVRGLPQPNDSSTNPYGATNQPSTQSYSGPAIGSDAVALLNALNAITGQSNLYATTTNGYGYGASQDATYGGSTTSTGYTAPPPNALPPPLHTAMPSTGRDEDEDRWKRSSKPDSGKANKKHVPASQNTWRPLCTFFARGRCRFGENCDFSHDPAKLQSSS